MMLDTPATNCDIDLRVSDLGLRKRDAAELTRLGSEFVYDLLWRLPVRYEDRRDPATLENMPLGEVALVRVTVVRRRRIPIKHDGRRLIKLTVEDRTGQREITLFNPEAWKLLQEGSEIFLRGRVDLHAGRKQLANVDFEPIAAGEPFRPFLPIYRGAGGIAARRVRVIMARLADAAAHRIPDPVPAALRARHGGMSLGAALQVLHNPGVIGDEDLEKARQTLLQTEAVLLAVAMLQRRRRRAAAAAVPAIIPGGGWDDRVLEAMGLTPTPDQRTAIDAVIDDLASGRAMRRLLQGDVGSGKTLVSAWAIAAVGLAGHQSALLAPTEILARQHQRFLRPRLERLGISSGLLVGSTPRKDRQLLIGALQSGKLDVLVGTHALLEPDVRFADLRLAIVDEQHKFGVRQRETLVEKGADAHCLVVTATPMPRTLTLALHGDLDISIIRTRPPGRGPVETRMVPAWMLPRVLSYVRLRVSRGEHVYVVCPAVEDDPDADQASVETVARVLEGTPLMTEAGRVVRLHGKMTPGEKSAAMHDFVEGRGRVLVSSTVVEVGVDVRDATLMVILDAGRFGLTQLHQLRGRIGRGPKGGVCLLVAYDGRAIAWDRLATLCATTDGFAVAEADLSLRGPGEFFADRQHGAARLRLLDLARDVRWLDTAFVDLEDPAWAGLPDHPITQGAVSRHFGDDVTFASAAGG